MVILSIAIYGGEAGLPEELRLSITVIQSCANATRGG